MERLIFFLLLLFVLPLKAEPALKINIAFEDKFDPDFEKLVEAAVPAALLVVASFPPKFMKNNNPFNWTADRSILEGKTMTISIAHSRSKFLDYLRLGPGGNPKSLDAITFSPVDTKKRVMPIVTVLFADRLFFFGEVERHDSVARLILALAHEFYGNVQRFLLMDFKNVKPLTREMRAKGEAEAFEASVRFLEDLTSDPRFSEFPKRVQEIILEQLPREKRGLENWRSELRKCQGHLN